MKKLINQNAARARDSIRQMQKSTQVDLDKSEKGMSEDVLKPLQRGLHGVHLQATSEQVSTASSGPQSSSDTPQFDLVESYQKAAAMSTNPRESGLQPIITNSRELAKSVVTLVQSAGRAGRAEVQAKYAHDVQSMVKKRQQESNDVRAYLLAKAKSAFRKRTRQRAVHAQAQARFKAKQQQQKALQRQKAVQQKKLQQETNEATNLDKKAHAAESMFKFEVKKMLQHVAQRKQEG